ncbi:MAG: hypothetical protein ACOC1K_04835 [Nanoarchaeota archaeon]
MNKKNICLRSILGAIVYGLLIFLILFLFSYNINGGVAQESSFIFALIILLVLQSILGFYLYKLYTSFKQVLLYGLIYFFVSFYLLVSIKEFDLVQNFNLVLSYGFIFYPFILLEGFISKLISKKSEK